MHEIKLTPTAQQHLVDSLTSSPAGTLGIRLGLRDAGCSGYAYTVDYAKEQHADDQVIDLGPLKLFVASDALNRLQGMEIDYVQQGVNSILQFNNPNVVDQCGCGESFKFKDSDA